jgi:uncharacterized protein YacL
MAPTLGAILGALICYVIGGVVGRFIERRQDRAGAPFAKIPPGEFFAGLLTALAGMMISVAVCIPLVALVHSVVVYAAVALVTWLLAWSGFKIGAEKGRQVVAAVGLTRILAPPTEPPPGYALLVDTSALMDRSLMVLGRTGLLVGGLVIPRFVIDQVQAMTSAPDLVTNRRARRGLESLEALRELGVAVHIAENQLPEIDNLNERLLEICRRLGLRLATCSKATFEKAEARGLRVTNLRRIAGDLTPDFSPGEKLIVDLVKAGNQPRQAVGYLPDGDMVVVNDAAQAIGREAVVVEVQTTRVTSQGLMVFAVLAETRPAATAERSPASNGTNGNGNGTVVTNGNGVPAVGARREPAAPTTPR